MKLENTRCILSEMMPNKLSMHCFEFPVGHHTIRDVYDLFRYKEWDRNEIRRNKRTGI